MNQEHLGCTEKLQALVTIYNVRRSRKAPETQTSTHFSVGVSSFCRIQGARPRSGSHSLSPRPDRLSSALRGSTGQCQLCGEQHGSPEARSMAPGQTTGATRSERGGSEARSENSERMWLFSWDGAPWRGARSCSVVRLCVCAAFPEKLPSPKIRFNNCFLLIKGHG